jgi:hypothetical protein
MEALLQALLLLLVVAMPMVTVIDEVVDDPTCGTVRVIEHANAPVVTRFMSCGHTSIGAAFAEPAHAQTQIVYMAMIVQGASAFAVDRRAAHPPRALCLGLGAGAVPRALRERYGLVVDVVERSAAVAAMASRHFGHDGSAGRFGRTVIADASAFLHQGEDAAYDIIVTDLFDGSTSTSDDPEERSCDGTADGDAADLLSLAQLGAIRTRWLTRRGLLVLNVVSGLGSSEDGAASSALAAPAERAAAQLARAFRHVRAFADHDPSAEDLMARGRDAEEVDAADGMNARAGARQRARGEDEEGGQEEEEQEEEEGRQAGEACNVIFFASDAEIRFELPAALLHAAAAAEADGVEGGEARVLANFERRWELPRLSSGAGWADRETPAPARVRAGAARAAESMRAVQSRTLPPEVAEAMLVDPRH